ncbi:MAG: NrdH-redoxin [Anaerolineales bacterium]|nr:NrdH-redoxin [Anaerolineales bacterium]MCX7608302.1 NrdH-redoxin [Anaerolineales bacterium]MDW8227331.1 glutaredoxin domain-containing protein [Anaerolineales bacterium]
MIQTELLFYGTEWCGMCRATRQFFEQNAVPYRWIDIDKDEEAARFVESVANGFRSVPTIVWPDGSFLVEPPLWKLAEKLNLPYP